jgi:hypothetical protein
MLERLAATAAGLFCFWGHIAKRPVIKARRALLDRHRTMNGRKGKTSMLYIRHGRPEGPRHAAGRHVTGACLQL